MPSSMGWWRFSVFLGLFLVILVGLINSMRLRVSSDEGKFFSIDVELLLLQLGSIEPVTPLAGLRMDRGRRRAAQGARTRS